jgi:hypothetical protein
MREPKPVDMAQFIRASSSRASYPLETRKRDYSSAIGNYLPARSAGCSAGACSYSENKSSLRYSI